MNIVFLTSESTHQYYLINEVNRLHSVRKVFFQQRSTQPGAVRNRVKRFGRPSAAVASIRSLLERILFQRGRRLERQFEERRFFPDRTPVLDSSIPVEFVRSFNDIDVVSRVHEESPDIIIVFGTDILKGPILRAARVAILNIHRAIVPQYRGGGHPFWAFLRGDFDHIGTTVHVCSNHVDEGDIVGQKLYVLTADDRIYMLRYRTTLVALEILRNVIPRLMDGSIEYVKQAPGGKTWRAKDLTVWKQLVACWKFRRHVRLLKATSGGRSEFPATRRGSLPE